MPILKLALKQAFDLLHNFTEIVSRPLNSAFAALRAANARFDFVERPVRAATRREPTVRPDESTWIIGRYAPIIQVDSPVNSRIKVQNEISVNRN